MARKPSSPVPESHSDSSADNEIEHAEGDADVSDGEEQSHESEPHNDDESEQEEGEEEKQESEEDGDGDGDEDESSPVSTKEPSVQKDVSMEGSESSEKSGSGQDQGQDSGSESEESPAVPVKPIRTKPMEAPSGVKKSDPKKAEPKSVGKRLMESVQKAQGSRKKAKVTKGDEEKKSMNRLWSEEDEIGILQGMIDYKLEKKEDPHSDFDAFHEFVKDSFHVDVSMKQLTDKIRRLKKKYMLNVQKGNVAFVKPHEEKSFRLSKKIWGGSDAGSSAKANGVDGGGSKGRPSRRKDKKFGKANGKVDVVMGNGGENGDDVVAEEDKDVDFRAMYPYVSRAWDSDVTCSQTLKDFMTETVGLIGSRKMNEMEKEWKDICLREMRLYVRKLDVKRKLAQVALDQMTSSDS